MNGIVPTSPSFSFPVAIAAFFCFNGSLAAKSTSSDSSFSSNDQKYSRYTHTRPELFWHRKEQFTYRGTAYGITGFPLALLNTSHRWTVGGKLNLSNLSLAPFRYRIGLHWARSTGNKNNYVMKVVIPQSSKTGFGIRFLINTGRSEGLFHGRGNNSKYFKSYTEHGSGYFRAKNYYRYFVDRTRFLAYLDRNFFKSLSASIGIGFQRGEVATQSETSHLFINASDQLGNSNFRLIGISVIWDSRDDPRYASTGVLHLWSYERTYNFHSKIAAASNAERFTVNDIRYRRFSRRITYASRYIFEWINGTTPIDLFGEIGDGFNRIEGLGGNDTMRGFSTHRFIDNLRFVSNTEFRFWLATTDLLGQNFRWSAILFRDSGRVWSDLPEIKLKHLWNLHSTLGGGINLLWNQDLVVRFEIGRSSEENLVLFQFGRSF